MRLPYRLAAQSSWALLLLAVIGGGRQPAAEAYEITGLSWPQDAPGDPITLTYSYRNLLDGGLLDASNEPVDRRLILTSVEEAFSVWAAVAPLHFVEVPDDGGSPSGQPGIIRLGYGPIDGRGNIKAQAYYPPPVGQFCATCGDVHFDVQERWETIGTLDLPDLLGAAIHEIGHSLGLGHTEVSEANMFPVFRRHTGPGSGWLHPDDIAGIRAIYGEGTGSVIPLARVPEPSTAVLLAGAGLSALACTRRHTNSPTRAV